MPEYTNRTFKTTPNGVQLSLPPCLRDVPIRTPEHPFYRGQLSRATESCLSSTLYIDIENFSKKQGTHLNETTDSTCCACINTRNMTELSLTPPIHGHLTMDEHLNHDITHLRIKIGL